MFVSGFPTQFNFFHVEHLSLFVVLLWVVVFYLYGFQIESIYEVKPTAECSVGDTGSGVTCHSRCNLLSAYRPHQVELSLLPLPGAETAEAEKGPQRGDRRPLTPPALRVIKERRQLGWSL